MKKSSTARANAGSHPVVRLPLKQWMLRITAYADRLANELEDLGWPESISCCSETGSDAASEQKWTSPGERRASALRVCVG